MDPKNIDIASYDYELPDNRIAYYPLSERDQSKLLVYQNASINDDVYNNIAQYIPADSLMIFNNTKVIEARIVFQKETGGTIELFCLEPAEKNIAMELALGRKGFVDWKCMVGGASKWKKGLSLEKHVTYNNENIVLRASYVSQDPGTFIIHFEWTPVDLSFIEILHVAGAIPLPPYIKRKAETTDSDRYQTIYAQSFGSVAAPTAGLHFTEKIVAALSKKNIEQQYLTLHVGAGTFKPVKSATLAEHDMHAESIEISKSLLEKIISKKGSGKIVAVGTTSLRSIESLYWLGCNLMEPNNIEELQIKQWDPYRERGESYSVTESLNALLSWMNTRKLEKIFASTQIIIAPGYKLKIADALVTNFHQPRSTLLVLIAALIGDEWKDVYRHALDNNYRFLSYGDGSLIWPNK